MTKEENKYIMIICDHFTKWIKLYALKTMEVAGKISSFVCRYGVPHNMNVRKLRKRLPVNYKKQLSDK